MLNEATNWLEGLCAEDQALNQQELQRQAEAGIQTIEFSDELGQQYLEQAYSAGWQAFIENNPETGPKLQELLSQ